MDDAAGRDSPSVDWQPGGGLLIWLLLLIAPAVEAIQTRDAEAWWVLALLVVYGAGFALVVYQFEHGASPRIRYPVLVGFVIGGLALTTLFDATATFVVVFTSMAVAIGLPLIRPAFLGLLAVTAAAMIIGIPGGAFAVLGLGFGTYIAGFVTFVMRRLFVTIAELQRARQELARAAVAEERLRFARDLHDLLGHSLSVIVVKAELIRRLATADPSAAETAAADIETVGRQALVEVRDAVSGYRRQDLRTEIARAEHALADAGIVSSVQLPAGEVDAEGGRDPGVGRPRGHHKRLAAQRSGALLDHGDHRDARVDPGAGRRRPRRRPRRRRCSGPDVVANRKRATGCGREGGSRQRHVTRRIASDGDRQSLRDHRFRALCAAAPGSGRTAAGRRFRKTRRQVAKGELVARDSQPDDRPGRHRRDERAMPELLPCRGVRQVDLDQVRRPLGHGVPHRDRVVRPRRRIEHDRDPIVGCCVQPVDQLGLGVGLAHLDRKAERAARIRPGRRRSRHACGCRRHRAHGCRAGRD